MTRALVLALGLLFAGAPAAGQVADSARDTIPAAPEIPTAPELEARQDTVAGPPTTPRGAMFRSFVLPGWGQARYETYVRGGVYFSGWAANWFMIFRNAVRLGNAEDRFDVRRDQIVDELLAASPNPDSLQAQLDSFPAILDDAVRADEAGNDLRKLVRARRQQQEDWIAWSLFWILASGVDAYVTAQLADFPAEVDLEPSRDGSLSVRLEVPWPRHARSPKPHPPPAVR